MERRKWILKEDFDGVLSVLQTMKFKEDILQWHNSQLDQFSKFIHILVSLTVLASMKAFFIKASPTLLPPQHNPWPLKKGYEYFKELSGMDGLIF